MKIPRSKRVPFRVLVKYGNEKPPVHSSFVTDFSESGIKIQTNKVFKPGTVIYMTIKDGETVHECEGVVTWAKRVPPGMERVVKCGMGIRFSSIPQGLLDSYSRKIL